MAEEGLARWRRIDRVKVLTQGRTYQGTSVFASLPTSTLRRIATKMELCPFQPGATIMREGDPGDSMYVILEGRCSVTWQGKAVELAHDLRDGDMFGEIALLTEQSRSVTISAKEETVYTLRLAKADVKDILDTVWSSDETFQQQRELLALVPLFQKLSSGEMLQVATQMEAVVFEDKQVIVQQGEPGDCMYVVVEGEPRVFVDAVGMVAQLQPNDFFGELAIVDTPTCSRTATVRAVGRTGLLRLSQSAVSNVLASETCQELLQLKRHQYLQNQRLRTSPLVLGVVGALWNLMVATSQGLAKSQAGAAGRWELNRQRHAQEDIVTREGYTEIHLRISKVLKAAFNLAQAKDIASKDWVEDITSFSGDSAVNVWLEEVKKKLRAATKKTVAALGWQALFDRFDTDGSGLLDASEFIDAVRQEMEVSETIVNDEGLQALFKQADADGGGDISSAEFAEWLASENVPGDEENDAKFAIQEASRTIVANIGWERLFTKYDTDGGGSLDFREFSLIIRNDCRLHAGIVGPQELRDLFNAVDVDRSAEIDAEEFSNFIKSDPLAMDMTFEVFAESCYQMAHLWVAEPDEDQYAIFLSAIFYGIANIEDSPRNIVSATNATEYKLGSLADVKPIVNADGTLNVPGVKTRKQDPSTGATGVPTDRNPNGEDMGESATAKKRKKKKEKQRKRRLQETSMMSSSMSGTQQQEPISAENQEDTQPHDDRFGKWHPRYVAKWPKELRGPDSDGDSDDGSEAGYGYGYGYGEGDYGRDYGCPGSGRGDGGYSYGYGGAGYDHDYGHPKRVGGHQMNSWLQVALAKKNRSFPRHSVAGFRAIRCSVKNRDVVERKPNTNEVMRPPLVVRAERSGIPIVGERVGRRVTNLRSSCIARRRKVALAGSRSTAQQKRGYVPLRHRIPTAKHTVVGGEPSQDATPVMLAQRSSSSSIGTKEWSAADDQPSSPSGSLSPTAEELGVWGSSPRKIGWEQSDELPQPRVEVVADNTDKSTDGDDRTTLPCSAPRVLPPLEQPGDKHIVRAVPVPLLSSLSVDDLIRDAPFIAAARNNKGELKVEPQPEPEPEPEPEPVPEPEPEPELEPELVAATKLSSCLRHELTANFPAVSQEPEPTRPDSEKDQDLESEQPQQEISRRENSATTRATFQWPSLPTKKSSQCDAETGAGGARQLSSQQTAPVKLQRFFSVPADRPVPVDFLIDNETPWQRTERDEQRTTEEMAEALADAQGNGIAEASVETIVQVEAEARAARAAHPTDTVAPSHYPLSLRPSLPSRASSDSSGLRINIGIAQAGQRRAASDRDPAAAESKPSLGLRRNLIERRDAVESLDVRTKLALGIDGMDELKAAQEEFAKKQRAREEASAEVRAEQARQQAAAREVSDRKIANVMERGCVSYEQAEELLEETNGHAAAAIRLVDPLLPGEDPDGLHSLFDSIDEDGSGTLEREEIASLAKEMDTPLTERELDVAMATMDADGSGEVDFEEFSEWYTSMRKKGRMPSWGRAITELRRRGGRKQNNKLRRSLSSDAAADQRAAMAMRSR